MGYNGYETIRCSMFDIYTHKITDMIDALVLFGCGYKIGMKSQFCFNCNDYQIVSSNFSCIKDGNATSNLFDSSYNPIYNVYYYSKCSKNSGNHFIGNELKQYTKKILDNKDKEYYFELPPYDELFKNKK